MKRLIPLVVLCAALCGCGKVIPADDEVAVVPLPERVVKGQGTFLLTASTEAVLLSGDDSLACVTGALDEVLEPVFGKGLRVRHADVPLDGALNISCDAAMPADGYRLEITPGRAEIVGGSAAGAFYAVQTLRQLIPVAAYDATGVRAVELPVVTIEDKPCLGYRGMMLDVCRHFFTVDEVKEALDIMALHKLNVFHWHLTDDQGWRIEIKKYPKLTEVGSVRSRTLIGRDPGGEYDENCKFDETPYGGYYTQDEIRDIVKYADDRGIKVIPEIEVPGHASASIYAYPWIGATSRREGKAVVGDLYDVTDPKVEEFLHDILDEVVALFPSKIVHIGGDEANYTHWQNSEEIQAFMKANGLPTCSDLQVWAINRMSKYLASKGCRMIGWNEITGDNVRGEAHVQASQSERLAPGTIVQFWDGDISLVNKAIEKGYDVVNSNRFFTYLDYPYEVTPFEKAYSFNPIPDGLADADKEKILGTGCQMWGEFTPNLDRLYYQIFPRIAAYAECGWTPADKKYYEDFRKRLKKIENIWKEKGYLKTQLDKY